MNDRALVRVLRANATFSAGSGLALLLFAEPIAGFMGGFPAVINQVFGVGLLLFAADVLWTSSRKALSAPLVKMICAADISWVVATPVAMLVFRDHLSLWGQMLLIDVALVVAALAFLQLRFLLRRQPLSS